MESAFRLLLLWLASWWDTGPRASAASEKPGPLEMALARAAPEFVIGAVHSKFFVLEPPLELQQVRGSRVNCDYHGHMYSFEVMYTEFFLANPKYLAPSAEEADFVIVPHCITYVYHILRFGRGFNTVALTWEALRIVQEDYLLPIIRWAQDTPAYQRFGGRNFVLVLALDKGRADYPLVSQATSRWHAITTVGSGSWMKAVQPWLVKDFQQYASEDVCVNQTSTSKRVLIYHDQDVVVPVPTAFHWSQRSSMTHTRNLTVFYSGTSNSCIRRHIVETLSVVPDHDVYVATAPMDRDNFSEYLYRSRYCLVPDGFSSISARLYEVLLHGCVPVLFGEAFHPPFESVLDFKRLAVFIRRTEVPYLPYILRSIGQEVYHSMHREIEAAQSVLNAELPNFWVAINVELQKRRRTG